ncbi:MAG TPA: di-heme oxidoredictase family protein, partial [Polyangiaceae bacterium]|nr:di-heme oxidoredictase family protein [Polyangiaceae bacterium]
MSCTPAIVAVSVALLGAASCSHAGDDKEPLAGGAATVFDASRNAFASPVSTLTERHRAQFFVGNSYFNDNWSIAPGSVDSRDGLGPLFNARSCSGCHFKDGRGRPPEAGLPMSTMLLRISIPGAGPHGEPVPDPVYGDQIQGSAVSGIAREADVMVTYQTVNVPLAGGDTCHLRQPKYELSALGYGPTAPGLLTSPRVAPAMPGLGLLEAVAVSELERFADPNDRDGDGISGRFNTVWDVQKGRAAVGRFGWKAEQPTVRQQSAGAFNGDLGITSSLFPSENPTALQSAARLLPNGGTPEVKDDVLDSVAVYARTLAVPARRRVNEVNVRRGERLFEKAR